MLASWYCENLHLAREVGAVGVVDDTFLSPALQNPLALGGDLVLRFMHDI
ncbi:PLP-dependent transferase [Shigella flexneri]